MKILVTGGAGFIGSHLSVALLEQGDDVAVIDDFNDFYDPRIKEVNVELIRKTGPVALYRGDIRDDACVNRAFREFRPEAVVHLAARAGVRPSLSQPLLYEQVNVGGTVVLLETARQIGTSKFVFASSSSVYGVANTVPFREDDLTLLPISPYAATKIAGEKMAFAYSHLYGMRVVCLRLFTVYGPRQRPDLAIRKFIELVEAGRPLPLFGDGTMGRDYTFVSDTVAGILAALRHDCAFDVFNLGNSAPVTLTEMVATIGQALGKTPVIDRQPVPPGDVPVTYADLTKSTAALGYRPTVPFAVGIRRTVEWFRATGGARP
jgi:UDP-glucuronate 4-epimerase